MIEVNINNNMIMSTLQMNVLGVIFGLKLQWNEKISYAIKKPNRALQAIRLTKNHFNSQELRTLITSNFCSILYYNSEIWHISVLKFYLKNLLQSASSNSLKICTPYYPQTTLFIDLHAKHSCATPAQFISTCYYYLPFRITKSHIKVG